MAVYQIGIKATVYHNEFIEAHSKREAEWIARELLEVNDPEWNQRLCDGLRESVAYDAKVCEAQPCEGDEPTLDFWKLEEYLTE